MGVHCGWGAPLCGVENVKAGVATSMPATVPDAPSPSPLPGTDETEAESEEAEEEDGDAVLRVVLLVVVVVVVTAPRPPGAGAGVAPAVGPAPVEAPRDRVWKKELKLSIVLLLGGVRGGGSVCLPLFRASPQRVLL